MAKLRGGAKALILRGHGAVGAKRGNGWNDWNRLRLSLFSHIKK